MHRFYRRITDWSSPIMLLVIRLSWTWNRPLSKDKRIKKKDLPVKPNKREHSSFKRWNRTGPTKTKREHAPMSPGPVRSPTTCHWLRPPPTWHHKNPPPVKQKAQHASRVNHSAEKYPPDSAGPLTRTDQQTNLNHTRLSHAARVSGPPSPIHPVSLSL